jgi:hypothetical protein
VPPEPGQCTAGDQFLDVRVEGTGVRFRQRDPVCLVALAGPQAEIDDNTPRQTA